MRAIFLLCLFAAGWPAQDFRSSVEIVVVPCSVVDSSGAPVMGLTRDEFHVFDNGVRRPVENFWLDTDQPLTLGVIIDASESQKEQLLEHRQTVADLFEKILKPGDRAFVVSVGDTVRLPVDVTEAADLHTPLAEGSGALFGEPCAMRETKIAGLGPFTACGSSPLWNAIYDTARLKLQSLTGNKALLMLTDGFDTGSTHSWNQAADAVNHADAALYAIQYKSGLGGSYAPDLYRLIVETGGARFSAPEGDFRKIASRLETDLRHRYVLGFRPERLSGRTKHEIRIEVTRPDLTVRARKSYFRDAP